MHKKESLQAKAKLAAIVAERVAAEPFERGGVMWAKVHQEPLAEHLNISVKTLHRWTNAAPFQREIGQHEGVPITLLRILTANEKPVKTPQHLANIMRKIWTKKVGAPLASKTHGCLIGLAQDWPEGHQLEIFKYVLDNWPTFMAATKFVITSMADDEGLTIKNGAVYDSALVKMGLKADAGPLPEAKGLEIRYLKFPSITYMRRFAEVGVAVYAQSLQEAKKPVPPAVMAIYGQSII